MQVVIRIAETQHPDRNRQFEIIAATKKRFVDSGLPIISVDSKKKELISNFKNPGKTWRKEADKVYDHDFHSHATGIASPYEICEPIHNVGTVYLGTSSDTAEFAVDCIEQWLTDFAQKIWRCYRIAYPARRWRKQFSQGQTMET
jgi:hypothetical protein